MAEIGDNSTAVAPAEIIGDEIVRMLAGFDERRRTLLDSFGRIDLKDNEDVGKAGSLKGMIATLIERVVDRAQEIAEPHTQAVSVARRKTDSYLTDLMAAKAQIDAKVDAFRNEQRKKAAAAQQKQADEVAQMRAAAGKPVEPAQPVEAQKIALPKVVGDLGGTVSDRKKTEFQIPDPRKVAKEILEHPKVAEAMQAACRDLYRIKKTIKGVIIVDGVGTQIRK